MSAAAIGYGARPGIVRRFLASRFVSVTTIVIAIIVLWYAAAIWKNGTAQAEMDRLNGVNRSAIEMVTASLTQTKPSVPAPHQVAIDTFRSVFVADPTTPASLVYHAAVTLSSTMVGFVAGTLLGILLAIGIVYARSLDKSLMPWIISSQTIPILAISPIVVVVAFNLLTGKLGVSPDFSRFVAKALISTYLSFFPVTVGMTKGLRSPDPIHLDLMRTYSATGRQVLWKLRVPASLPFLFTSMKLAIAASLVGTIVAELPTGAVAGIGAKLLIGSYYSQTIQLWSALIVASVMAGLLVAAVSVVQRIFTRRMGGRA